MENKSIENFKLTKELEKNIQIFKNIFSNDGTLIFRRIQNKYLKSAKCCILYIDGMVNDQIINENIIQPLLCNDLKDEISANNLLEELQYKVIQSADIKLSSDIYDIISSIAYGDTIFFLDGYAEVLILSSKGWKMRAIDEPSSERIVQGPREGFNESIIINLSLIRRKINNSDLKFKFKELGSRTNTKICICYIEGLASEKILTELEKRLDNIKIDGILDSGYIQELIKDSPLSPFETIGSTERPDVVAGKMLEGRIALVVDGSPFVLTLPYIFIEYFQANEDYYNNYTYASINRILRIVGILLSVSVPAVYVALVTFHQEMIPTPLLLSITAARQGVPFPTIVEAFVMLVMFEILREAGIRLPTTIGQAVSIVGALVLGQAASDAKLVSAPMVVVVAVSSITSFLVIKLKGAAIMIRMIFLFLAFFMGLYGYTFGFVGLIIYLMGMRTFGIPYMQGILSFNPQDVKDTELRAPWQNMYLRPKLIAAQKRPRK